MSKARDIADLGSNDVLETSSTGVEVTGDVSLGDNGKVKLGAGDDLQIYHSGSHSFISDVGTGRLYLQGTDGVRVTNASAINMISAVSGDGVYSYYNGSLKLATTSTGVDVTGTITADGLTIDGSTAINVPSSQQITFSRTGSSIGSGKIGADVSQAMGIWGNDGTKVATFYQNQNVEFYEDTGTTAKMFWDASAESLGIGTSSPAGLLHVDGFDYSYFSTNVGSATLDNAEQGLAIGWNKSSGGGETVLIANQGAGSIGGMAFATNTSTGSYNERMRIDSSGNVGIGTASPSQKLEVASGNIELDSGYSLFLGSDSNVSVNSTSSTRALRFQTGGSERARLDSSGNLLVGTTSGDFNPKMAVHSGGRSYALEVKAEAGTTAPLIIRNDNGASGTRNQVFFLYGGTTVGSITSTSSSTSYNTSSDERLKENIQDTTHTVDIDDIQVREFDWKVDGSHQRYGFIAQELETVYPEAVHSPEDADEMKSVDYSKLVPLLVKEIQQLKAEIKELKA